MSYKIINKDPLRGISRFNLLKKSAEKRNLEVSIEYSYFRKILKGNCFYCGTNLVTQKGYSVDRLENDKGYTKENSLGCCWDCNRAKGKKTHLEFYKWMNKLFFNQKRLFEIQKKYIGEVHTGKDLMDLVNSETRGRHY